jgi:hypothetical protein
MTPDEPHDVSLMSDTLPAGVRVREQIIEGFIRGLPEGRLYRVQHAVTGEQAMLHEYLPEAWVRRVGDNVSVIPGRGPEFRAGMQRFLLRAQQLRAMTHPTMPVLLDLIPSHGTAFAVYPLSRIRTLAEVVEQEGGRLALAQVWPWLNACCDLAQWLHDQGRIHGGFDPHSVWVQENGQLLLPPPELEEGYRPPSPWVALEQTVLASSGTPRGPWTDVYGVGGLACFMLTGQGPKNVMRRAMAAPRPAGSGPGWVDSRSAALDPVPGVLKAAIRVSLMPNPRERPQDIGQFRAMLGLAEQMSAHGSAVGDGFPDTEVGDSGFGGLAGDISGSPQPLGRDAQRAFARALQPGAGPSANECAPPAPAVPKRQVGTILQERAVAAHIPTLVMPLTGQLPAQLPAQVQHPAEGLMAGASAASLQAANQPATASGVTPAVGLAVMVPTPGAMGVSSSPAPLGAAYPQTQPAAWTESREMPETRPMPLLLGNSSSPRRRFVRGTRELALAGVAVLGLAMAWWLMAPGAQQPMVAAEAGPPVAAEATRPALPAPPAVAAAPTAAVAGPTEAAALPPPTRTAALDPDRLLAQGPPAAGPASATTETPKSEPAPAPAPAPAPPTVSTGTAAGPAVSPAVPRGAAQAKASDTAASRCRQALLEKSLGMASAASDVGKYCR